MDKIKKINICKSHSVLNIKVQLLQLVLIKQDFKVWFQISIICDKNLL